MDIGTVSTAVLVQDDSLVMAAAVETEEYDSPSTPPAQIANIDEGVLTSTPVSQKKEQIEELLSRLGATQAAIDSVGSFAMAVAISLKVLNSTPVKKALSEENDSFLSTAAPVIAGMLDLNGNLEGGHLNFRKFSPRNSKITKVISVEFTNKENFTTTIVNTDFKTGSRVTHVPSLGTYKDIAKLIKEINKTCGSDDKMIAGAIRKLSKNQSLDEPFKSNAQATKILSNLTTLLFIAEADRSFTSSIAAHMFLDLAEGGLCAFRQLSELFPMAMKGAMKASKTLDKLLFIPLIKNFKSYDSSDKTVGIKDEAVEKLIMRNKVLCDKWLELKESQSDAIDRLSFAEHVRNTLSIWYDFEIRPFALEEGEVLPFFTRDTGSDTFSSDMYEGEVHSDEISAEGSARNEIASVYWFLNLFFDSAEINSENYSCIGEVVDSMDIDEDI